MSLLEHHFVTVRASQHCLLHTYAKTLDFLICAKQPYSTVVLSSAPSSFVQPSCHAADQLIHEDKSSSPQTCTFFSSFFCANTLFTDFLRTFFWDDAKYLDLNLYREGYWNRTSCADGLLVPHVPDGPCSSRAFKTTLLESFPTTSSFDAKVSKLATHYVVSNCASVRLTNTATSNVDESWYILAGSSENRTSGTAQNCVLFQYSPWKIAPSVRSNLNSGAPQNVSVPRYILCTVFE